MEGDFMSRYNVTTNKKDHNCEWIPVNKDQEMCLECEAIRWV